MSEISRDEALIIKLKRRIEDNSYFYMLCGNELPIVIDALEKKISDMQKLEKIEETVKDFMVVESTEHNLLNFYGIILQIVRGDENDC